MTQPEFQYDLYNGLPPHEAASATSAAAAVSVVPHVKSARQRVFDFIRQRGNATCSEVEQALGMSHQTASARIRELFLRNFIRATGNVRRTSLGRNAVVWAPSF